MNAEMKNPPFVFCLHSTFGLCLNVSFWYFASSFLNSVNYLFFQLVRETAIQCLVAMSEFPHARIYPIRQQASLLFLRFINS